MSLQFKQLDLTSASLSNGALLDGGVLKSEDILEVGYKFETPINIDGHFNNLYGRAGAISNDGRIFIVNEYTNIPVFSLNDGSFLGKITTSSRTKRIRIYEDRNEIWVLGPNPAGDNNLICVFDLTTYVYKYGLLASYYSTTPDKTLGQIYHLHDFDVDFNNGYIYVSDHEAGCIQKYDLEGNWVELWFDSGNINQYNHLKIDDGYVYFFQFNALKKRCRINIDNKTEEEIVGTTSKYWGEEKGLGLEGSYAFFDFMIIEDKIFIWDSHYGGVEIWNKSDLSYYDDFIGHIWGGKKGQFAGDYNKLNLQVSPPQGLVASYNPTLKKILFNHQTYAVVMNTRFDQTALWQNQSLGGAGVINQIAIKQSDWGTKKWFIKKSSDDTWTEFEPNKYYSTPLLELDENETFDLKVEMGNFYEPIKEQIEIEEVSVFYTPITTSQPRVYNLTADDTQPETIILNWERNIVMDTEIQHSFSPIADWETIATVSDTSYTLTITNPDYQQIPHYFRVIGKVDTNYTQPSNIVSAYPTRDGNAGNIYKYCQNMLLGILSNDNRLSDIQEWLTHKPEKTTFKHKIVAWVEYAGEEEEQWVAIGEKEIHIAFEIGVIVKEVSRKDRFHSNDKKEIKDYLFQIKEILYEQNNRSLNDYIYDMELHEQIPYRHKDNHSIGIINVILKKRIRR